jgi:hypothetical protein
MIIDKIQILIAGVGQIGSRYLQGLASYPNALEIWLYDVSPQSLMLAKNRWIEVNENSNHVLYEALKIENLPRDIQLAIIASTADVRPHLVTAISSHAKVKYWILEKVLAQSVEGLKQISKSIPDNSLAWVNTPMYLYPLYREMCTKLKGFPVKAKFAGINGIASNAIHYIDFISRWNGATVNTVMTGQLGKWSPYFKRPNFYDVSGCLELGFTDGSTLQVEGISEKRLIDVNFSLALPSGELWRISEHGGKAKSSTGHEITAKGFYYQSELTATVINQIFSGHYPDLPTLSQSIDQHQMLLHSLLLHWNKEMAVQDVNIPIT